MKQQYCKVAVSVAVGNRKSQVQDAIEIEESANTFSGELITILLNVQDSITSLPCVNGNYKVTDIVDALCTMYELQRIPPTI